MLHVYLLGGEHTSIIIQQKSAILLSKNLKKNNGKSL